MKKVKVAVIMGGASFERKFSLESGKVICDALVQEGYEVFALDATEDLVSSLQSARPDVAFIAMHGAGGEDGTVAALLEFLDIPYVGSAPEAARVSFFKPALPFVLHRLPQAKNPHILCPKQYSLDEKAFRTLGAAHALSLAPKHLGGFPLVVKPARGGSALGFNVVHEADKLGDALMDALSYDDEVLLQEYIEGIELSIAVLEKDPGKPQALPAVEIEAASGAYNTEARLGHAAVKHHCPAQHVTRDMQELAASAALEAYKACGCKDLARVDMIVAHNNIYLLDVKVCPGFSKTSLVPLAIKTAHMSIEDVTKELVQRNIRTT